ncbi:hypothetical protein [Oceanithermus sp.]
MKLTPERACEAMMLAGAVFYMYWYFVEPNGTGMALAVGTLLGGASFQYRPRPRSLTIAIVFAVVLLVFHTLYGDPLAFGGGYLVGAGLPWFVYRFLNTAQE